MKPYQLDKNYRIEAEPDCWILHHLSSAGKQGMRWEPVGYYQGLGELMRGYMRRTARLKQTGAVEALQEVIRHAQGHLTPLKDKYGDVL
jgi:hypothetical protein